MLKTSLVMAGCWMISGDALAQSDVEIALRQTAAYRSMREARAPAEPTLKAYNNADGRAVSGIEPVSGSTAKAWGVKIVDLPVESVWKAVNDESRMAGKLPVSVSTVIGGRPGHAGRRVFEYMPLPLISDRWWVVDVAHNRKMYEASGGRLWEASWTDATSVDAVSGTSVEAQAADGYPVAWTYGSWLLLELGPERTLVEYYTWSDPGGAIPSGASRFAGGAVRDTLDAIEDLARSSPASTFGGYVRPDGSPL